MLCLQGITASTQDLSKEFLEVSNLAEKKQYREALVILDRMIARDSSCYYCYCERGMIYGDLEEMEKSFADLDRAVRLQPDSFQAYHARAIQFFRVIYSEAAILDNTRALERATNDSMRLISFTNRGNARQQMRDFQGAFEDYTRAWHMDTNNVTALNNMATSMDELGRVDEAIVYLKKVISIDPTFIGSYVNIGFQYTKMGRYKEALTYFDKAVAIDKDDPLALNNRGLAKYNLEDYDGAMKDINKSLTIYPGNSYAYKNRALVYIALKQKEKACSDLERAEELQFTRLYGRK